MMKHIDFYWLMTLIIFQVLGLSRAPYQQYGIPNQTTCLSLEITSRLNASQVLWTFEKQGKSFSLGSISEMIPKMYYIERFANRLRLHSNGTLQIDGLNSEDSGIYKAQVIATDGPQSTKEFILTVLDTIPRPTIKTEMLPGSSSSGNCSVTLECIVKGHTAVIYTWLKDCKPIINDSKHHLLGDNTLEVIMESDDASVPYTCRASNPISDSATSVLPWQICERKTEVVSASDTKDAARFASYYTTKAILTPLILGLLLTLVVSVHCQDGKQKNY